jgi:hypothetical protein
VANIDRVNRLSPIIESKTTRMCLLLLLLDVRGPTIICYICFVRIKQFKRFISKFFRILVIVDVLEQEPGKIAINPDKFDKLITALRTAVKHTQCCKRSNGDDTRIKKSRLYNYTI